MDLMLSEGEQERRPLTNLAQVRIQLVQKPSPDEDTVGTRNLAQVRIQLAPET
jgi:hypothetical protein